MSKIDELLKIANYALSQKRAFVDPAMMAGGGAPPPGMDPAAMGGAPPGMDPSMMGGAPPPGMDPAAAGGAPPSPAGGVDPMMLQQMIQQAVQQQMGSAGGAGAAGGGQLKPKIDVNVAIMQLSKMVARIADALGVQIPAHEMIATPQDLTAMAQQQASGAGGGGGAGAGGGGGASAIPPIEPMAGAAPGMGAASKQGYYNNGEATSDFGKLAAVGSRAAALAAILEARRA